MPGRAGYLAEPDAWQFCTGRTASVPMLSRGRIIALWGHGDGATPRPTGRRGGLPAPTPGAKRDSPTTKKPAQDPSPPIVTVRANAFGLEPRCNAPLPTSGDLEIGRSCSLVKHLLAGEGALHHLAGQMRLPNSRRNRLLHRLPVRGILPAPKIACAHSWSDEVN